MQWFNVFFLSRLLCVYCNTCLSKCAESADSGIKIHRKLNKLYTQCTCHSLLLQITCLAYQFKMQLNIYWTYYFREIEVKIYIYGDLNEDLQNGTISTIHVHVAYTQHPWLHYNHIIALHLCRPIACHWLKPSLIVKAEPGGAKGRVSIAGTEIFA